MKKNELAVPFTKGMGPTLASTGRLNPPESTPRLAIEPIDTSFSFKNKAYTALKNVIVSMDVYRSRDDIRLFVKLPDWFKVDTPVGTYNPDWPIAADERPTLP